MDAFLAECRKIRPLVLAESGCLMYDYTREIETGSDRQEPIHPDRITLYEKWAAEEALDIHNGMSYMDEFAARVGPLRESVFIRTGIEAIRIKAQNWFGLGDLGSARKTPPEGLRILGRSPRSPHQHEFPGL